MHRPIAAALAAAALFVALPALGQANDNQGWDGSYNQRAERRSDVVIGVNPGLVLGVADGYPNEVDKIDVGAYEAETGFGAGGSLQLWLGGAFTDWFTFGIGPIFYGNSGKKGQASGGALLARVEAFPLYGLGGPFRDWAFFTTFGAGGLTIKGKAGESGEGGFASLVGLGSAYELFRVSHFAFAPTAQYQHIRSQSMVGHQALIGIRALFYGGPG